MIVIKITNSSQVVAAKVGRLLERLTPDRFDLTTVEDIVIAKLAENLAAEGIEGEVAAVGGLDLKGPELVLQKGLQVRTHRWF